MEFKKVSKWLAPAKINLFLYILGQCQNGYHKLQTLFQFIDYCDIIRVKINNNGKIRLFSNINTLINTEKNLVVKAAKLLQNYCWPTGLAPGVDIILEKKIPIGSGLGGGSSDAATVLVALNREWKCFLNTTDLIKLSLKLGSDIPIFLYGKTAVAENFGEKLMSVSFSQLWYLIIVPPISIQTSWVFHMYKKSKNHYSSYRLVKELLNIRFSNDLERIVRNSFPIINMYHSYLSRYMSTMRLTGTGSCFFSEFNTVESARKIQSCLPKWMKSFIARGTDTSLLYKEF